MATFSDKIRIRLKAYDSRVLLPGLSDHLAYSEGLLDSNQPFEQLRAAAHINDRANRYADRRNFSALIRR